MRLAGQEIHAVLRLRIKHVNIAAVMAAATAKRLFRIVSVIQDGQDEIAAI